MNENRRARMLRYEIPVDDQWHTIDVPVMASPLNVNSRRPEVVEFWAEQWQPLPGEDDSLTVQRTFRVYRTGQPYNPHDVAYRGTAVTPGGNLARHLFEMHQSGEDDE